MKKFVALACAAASLMTAPVAFVANKRWTFQLARA